MHICMFGLILAILLEYHISQSAQANIYTLRLVQVLWRHGDRSATRTVPTDYINTEASWNWAGGMGELTELGMQQHYRLGSQIKQRYAGFISPNYDPKQIRVESSYYSRTVMSAMSNMAGMFPSVSNVPGTGIQFWKPVPVFTRPRDDPVVWPDKKCATFDNMFNQNVLKSKEVKDLLNRNQDFLSFLQQQSGLRLTSLTDIFKLADPLKCETFHPGTNPRPSWVNDTTMARIQDLYDLSTHYYYNDDTRRKIRGGPMLKEMIDRMDNNVASRGNSSLKYFVYSAHDTNIMALLEVLGTYWYIPKSPAYATAVFMELHENPPGNYIVEAYYLNETGNDRLVPILIGGCGNPCSLAQFKQRSQIYIPVDWEKECGNKQPSDMLNNSGTGSNEKSK